MMHFPLALSARGPRRRPGAGSRTWPLSWRVHAPLGHPGSPSASCQDKTAVGRGMQQMVPLPPPSLHKMTRMLLPKGISCATLSPCSGTPLRGLRRTSSPQKGGGEEGSLYQNMPPPRCPACSLQPWLPRWFSQHRAPRPPGASCHCHRHQAPGSPGHRRRGRGRREGRLRGLSTLLFIAFDFCSHALPLS